MDTRRKTEIVKEMKGAGKLKNEIQIKMTMVKCEQKTK
jgi:hypothetical protein